MEILSKNKIKWIRSLRLKKNRDLENAFIVEGKKMLEELIENQPELIVFICSAEEMSSTIINYRVDSSIMQEISNLKTPNLYLTVVHKPKLKREKEELILALDGIRDPGNLGTIIRTSDWFGVDKIICSTDTVDIYNPKVVQSSMGSIFRVPIVYENLSAFLDETKNVIYGGVLNGKDIYSEEISKKCVILIGNEGKGISSELENKIQNPIQILKRGGGDSLNAAIATSIVLSEYARRHSS